jgi:hypothetical protein
MQKEHLLQLQHPYTFLTDQNTTASRQKLALLMGCSSDAMVAVVPQEFPNHRAIDVAAA